jgi:hypothetical protein
MTTFLIIYATTEAPLRSTVSDQLYAIRKYGGVSAVYVNAAAPGAGRILRMLRPDVIVFHTILLAQRWNSSRMAKIERRLASLRESTALKVALPQDEFLETEYLCRFINEFGVRHVYSVAPESEWQQIYGRCDPMPTITRVLTGYLDEDTVGRIDQITRTSRRSIDIGYRAWHAEPWLGAFGQLKIAVGDRVAAAAPAHRLSTSISTRSTDTLLGDDWFRFLATCRYTVGVEGGASIHDRDGTLVRATRAYAANHPDATFAEIEAACFPGRDWESGLRAISPRHLEAVATRTGQVLIEGDYNGILRPWIHYIPLRADFANLDSVLDQLHDEKARLEMTERAYNEIVGSRAFTTRSFAQEVVRTAMCEAVDRPPAERRRAAVMLAGGFESLSWAWARTRSVAKRHLVDPYRRSRRGPTAGIRHVSGEAR